MAIHSSGHTIYSLAHIEGIKLGADEVAGGARGMDMDKIGEVGDRANEGQVAGMYETGFTADALARKGIRNGTWGLGIEVDSVDGGWEDSGDCGGVG